MVDNFRAIEPLLQFNNEGDFYFIQLLKRRKDNPLMEVDMRVINNYFIYSIDDLRGKAYQIIQECKLHNARAYIRVNVRNAEKIAFQTLKKVTDMIISKDYKAVKNAYLSAAGEYHSQDPKRWIVDIDLPKEDFAIANHNAGLIENTIKYLHSEYGKTNVILMNIPTKNGYHIITNPFRLDLFKEQFPDVDVHKDNPTVLYIPPSEK